VPDAPLPVRVSLADVDALDRSDGFRDRLLSVALRHDKAEDRPFLRTELEQRLDIGGTALLLDSLDETYDRRGAVVGEIGTFLKSVSPDVDVLVATRDVAYGQAATLEWGSIRLLPPKHAERIVTAVLRRSTARAGVSEDNAEQWAAERADWVQRALADATLRETPLLPILPLHEAVDENSVSGVGAAWDIETSEGTAGPLGRGLADAELDDEVVFGHNDRPEPAAAGVALSRREELPGALPAVALVRRQRVIDHVRTTELVEFAGIPTGSECFETTYHGLVCSAMSIGHCLAQKSWQALASEATGGPADHIHAVGEVDPSD